MRCWVRVAACVGFALLTAACNSVDSQYFRQGIGPELYGGGVAEATAYENLYVSHICEQAFGASEQRCVIANWSTFVQAGMNDIDRRCDGYLAWLDDRKRSREPILKQIADTAFAATGIMRLAGAGADPITIAGLAFGFATNTFTNINSRLLTELNHSTVQTVVLRRQTELRNDLKGRIIATRPEAIHALRQYLRICMPFTIETEINTTITTLELGGVRAVDQQRKNPLVSAENVGVRLTAHEPPTKFRPRPDAPTDPRFAEIFDPYVPRVHTVERVKRIQDVLCAPAAEAGLVGPVTKALITIFEQSYDRARVNGKLDNDEIDELFAQGRCSGSMARNYFERRNFGDNESARRLVVRLNRVPEGGQLPATASLADARSKIAAVRKAIEDRGTKLLHLPTQLRGQMTRDLFDAL